MRASKRMYSSLSMSHTARAEQRDAMVEKPTMSENKMVTSSYSMAGTVSRCRSLSATPRGSIWYSSASLRACSSVNRSLAACSAALLVLSAFMVAFSSAKFFSNRFFKSTSALRCSASST